MTDLLLAKPQLDDSWIDLSVGEANLIRANLLKHFSELEDPTILALNHGILDQDFEYPSPAGYKPLTQLLEQKHGAPVVIGNGAKQLLGAVFAALKKRCISTLFLQPTFWALLPPLAFAHGLDVEKYEPNDWEAFKRFGLTNIAYLLLAPNNPDGHCSTNRELYGLTDRFQDKMVPLIHDAAYYTHSYLPSNYKLGPVGDVQIYSFSKMLGLSGIRGGYAVCYDKSFYKDLMAYQEMMTVGVSILTQKYLHFIMEAFNKKPTIVQKFESDNFGQLQQAKSLLKEIPKDILDVPDNVEETNGMFFWGTLHKPEAFQKAKIHIVSGQPFGDKSKVRLNLGIGNNILETCVKRLKEVS